jgi:hypothetical protein
MNERIRQLAEQAQKVAYYTDGGYTPIMTLDQEKFSELIVQECAGQVDHILREKKDGGGTMGDEIREHFGVEE